MNTLTLLVVAAMAVGAAAAAKPLYKRVNIESAVERHLDVLGRVEADHDTEFRVLLEQQNVDELKRIVEEVSTPGHPNYQKYKTREFIRDLVSPAPEHGEAVAAWLRKNGASYAVPMGDYVAAAAPASAVESMFSAELYHVVGRVGRDNSPQRVLIGSGGYTLHEDIVAHGAEMLVGITETARRVRFGRKHHKHRHGKHHHKSYATAADGAPTPSSDAVIPLTFANQYGLQNLTAQNTSQQVIEFESDGYSKSDMKKFVNGVGLTAVPDVVTKGSTQGAKPDGEGTLDIQFISAVSGTGATSTFWALDGSWILIAAQDLMALSSPPLINSISWGAGEVGDGEAYNAKVDVEYAKLGARGVTILAASGDDGAGNGDGCTITPSYPAASNYALSVGATMFVQSTTTTTSTAPVCQSTYTCAATGTEQPAMVSDEDFASGGGFSVYNTRPSWQDAVVEDYLQAGIPLPPSSSYNSSNRGFPDVSALGYNGAIFESDSGGWQAIGGTSMSTPIFGGILSLVNTHLAANGKQPVGFVNPLLYKIAAENSAAFTSIGNSNTNNKDGCADGYVSNPSGWDPVTGLGTPNTPAIISYIDSNLDMFADRF